MNERADSAKVEAYIAKLQTSEAIKTLFRRYGVGYAWMAMTTVMIAMLATLLTGTIVNVAIPQIMGSYGIGQDQAQWLSTANLAAATVGMLLSFWMVQSWGLRNMLLITMGMFLFGSILGGISPNIEVMIIARIIQGFSSGVITPLTMSIIFVLFPANKMGMAMGISSIGAILAPALGPTIGGIIIDTYNWRYVYFLGVPLSFICMPLALMLLPGRDRSEAKIPFDWLGVISLSSAITWMFVALSNGEKQGWSSDIILSYALLSAISWAIFVYWQTHTATPLLNLKIFSQLRFAIFALTAFVFGAGLYGSTYLIPLFLQIVQGMSPTDSGLAMMPSGILMGLVIPFCGRMSDKIDARIMMTWGSLFFFLSFYLMTDADPNTGFWTFAWWMCLGRIGIGLAIPAMSIGAIRSVSAEFTGQASGVLNFVRQLGGAFGVNLLSLILARRTQFHVDSLYSTQSVENATTMELLEKIQQRLMEAGLPAIEQSLLSLQFLAASLHAEATVIAFKDGFLISAMVFLLTLIPIWMLKKSEL